MLLILQSIVANKGTVDEKDFAKRLHNWMKQGFPELGDGGGCGHWWHHLCSHIGGLGIGMTVSRVLHHDLLLTDPHAAAKDVWERSG